MKTPLLLLAVSLALPASAQPGGDTESAIRDLGSRARSSLGRRPGPGASTPADHAGAPAEGASKSPAPSAIPSRPVVAAAQSAEGWADDAEAGAGLSEEARKAGYRIQSRLSGDGAKEYNVITPPDFLPEGSRSYRGVRGLRGLGHFLVYELPPAPGSPGGVAYQDLNVRAEQRDALQNARPDFATVAQLVNGESGRFASVLSQSGGETRFLRNVRREGHVLRDGLERLGFSAGDIDRVAERVHRNVGDGEYVILSATRRSVVIARGGNTQQSIAVFP